MLKSGFYNAMKVNSVYDRKYNADDYSNVFSAFIRDGVRRSGANDLYQVGARTFQYSSGGRKCRMAGCSSAAGKRRSNGQIGNFG